MTTITYPHDCAAHAFRPHVPSPLSPRSNNIYGRRSDIFFMNEEAVDREERKLQPANFTTQPKREVRKAKVPKQDELKEKRRHMFLRKVKEGREDKRWESRGEDIMRLDFMQRQRAWEAELAREAPMIPSDPAEPEEEEGEEGFNLPTSSNEMQISQTSEPPREDEADEIAQQEEEELEALLEYMPRRHAGPTPSELNETHYEHLWSDDDDYDALFSELVESDGAMHEHQHGQENTAPMRAQQQDDDMMMDLS
ncbi:hypothetical protein KC332_g15776 [Hortaea werneckii]|uniref:Uncharacterized protein n=2 Tax=Hortaea werneckii TaxID=91943 RepID=A0A3M7I389_HORWE|nr:hypothetical protein KC350_g15542 [Hortaea werneckii]OTA23587.1 hypothetical protein BTJ68_13219 [Hortaea werneckii EXF-2000]KAI6847024.1 hypothetical protein KC358_g2550 [Hortaea werneckii]KAI6903118.1 hypothetical protein KC348_g15798 [Hortaea werneckii]KAI6932233.1 hypothetical protein KC341_g9104 [Hortaea werneckii]